MKKGFVRLAMPDIQEDSIVDGEGIRSVIWFQGCPHHCKECHNPETWDFDSGVEVSIDDIKKQIDELEFQAGVTFSGGDPMSQIEALVELAKYVKEKGMNVWCYTGFLYEDLEKMGEKNPLYKEVFNYIDVLVDGPFVLDLKSFEVAFRGSSNQRLIDIPKTLEKGKVITLEKYK
jgi:anaerobic ribonucleoside-triphosphate reductase activating protein